MKKQKGAVPKLVHPLFLLTINYCQPGFCTKLVFKTNSSVGNGLNNACRWMTIYGLHRSSSCSDIGTNKSCLGIR